MSSQLRTYVLAVDTRVIYKANKAVQFSKWKVDKDQGPVERDHLQNVPTEVSISDPPQLSSSIDTFVDRDAVEFASASSPLDMACIQLWHRGSCTGNGTEPERCISSGNLDETLVSVIKGKGPLSASLRLTSVSKNSVPVSPSYKRSTTTVVESQPPVESKVEASPVSPQSPPQKKSRTTVIRGFKIPPSSGMQSNPASVRASSDAISQSTLTPASGGSCLSSEQDQSPEDEKRVLPIIKKPMFQIGGSSEEGGSLKSAAASSRSSSMLSSRKKQASFSSSVMTRTVPDDEVVVDSDTDYIGESAIEDDDSSDWEDSVKDSGKSSMDDMCFQRVDSKPVLTSRESLITQMLTQNERGHTLGNHASQSTSAIPRSRVIMDPSLGTLPNGSDDAPLTMKNMRGPGLEPIHEVPRPKAQPIMVGTNHAPAQAALSPRTTRRNMLATELTESLRRHLLWESQQKSSTANAVLKRRHTSHDVANLKQYPEEPCMRKSEDVNASSWNRYFPKEAFDGYHSKGW